MATKERKPTEPYGEWFPFLVAPHIEGRRARFRLPSGHAVKAQVLPAMDRLSYHWGVIFPAVELEPPKALKDGVIQLAKVIPEHRLGGHVPGFDREALQTAKEAAERAARTGAQEYRHDE